jgi:hypothetical protein
LKLNAITAKTSLAKPLEFLVLGLNYEFRINGSATSIAK